MVPSPRNIFVSHGIFSSNCCYPLASGRSVSFSMAQAYPVIPNRERVTSESLKLRPIGQVAPRDSLKSILHARYPRLSPFIGDYSSVSGKEGRSARCSLERIENARYRRSRLRTGFVIPNLLFHFLFLSASDAYLVTASGR